MTLFRDGQNSLHNRQPFWISRSNILVEGPERRESRIPAADGIVAVPFKMVEESEHYRRVQVRESQCGQRAVVPLLNKPKQQSEGVAIAGDSTRAGISLRHQPLAEEVLQQGCEGRGGRSRFHGLASIASFSNLVAASASKSGEPVRYQYVSVTCA